VNGGSQGIACRRDSCRRNCHTTRWSISARCGDSIDQRGQSSFHVSRPDFCWAKRKHDSFPLKTKVIVAFLFPRCLGEKREFVGKFRDSLGDIGTSYVWMVFLNSLGVMPVCFLKARSNVP
jgi:hypothetical protein